jgi:hypothetical protein
MNQPERATLDTRSPGQLTADLIRSASALTQSVARSLADTDPEAAAAFWSCLGIGGSIELRLEARYNGMRLMIQAAPPGGDPVRVLDVPLPMPESGPGLLQ